VPALPVESVLTELRAALAETRSAVLVAPPGAGKTTIVPPALLGQSWLRDQRIVMLEPRRLAARAAAARIADGFGQQVGQTVGYRVRLDSRVGPTTRIEIVTEGILTQFLQTDPSLAGTGLVVFDEFHERSVHADLGLALCLDAREALRPDLRILVMSATLDPAAAAGLLGDAPIVRCEGRQFPVETHYLGTGQRRRPVAEAVSVVQRALREEGGSVLTFLPGAAEIRRAEGALKSRDLPDDTTVAPLYGNLPRDAQDAALLPPPPGARKVVLATSIAETSLTIEGIRIVVDSGLRRVPVFSPRTGMSRLETVRISRAAAEQRRGRAGRLESGVCYRLWTQAEQATLDSFEQPAILNADLCPLALELAAWGVREPDRLAWLDPPPAPAYREASELLRRLGALDADCVITAHGNAMRGLGLHPRLAHMTLVAQTCGQAGLACDLAALLEERDILRGIDRADVTTDLRTRLDALRQMRRAGRGGAPPSGVDPAAAYQVIQQADRLRQRLGGEAGGSTERAGELLAFAYPDRIAQHRRGQPGRFLLANGRGAAMMGQDPLAQTDYVVAADLDSGEREARIYRAAPVDRESLERDCSGDIDTVDRVEWDRRTETVIARRERRLGTIVLAKLSLASPDPQRIAAAVLDAIRTSHGAMLPWDRPARDLQARTLFVAALPNVPPDWPDLSDAGLLMTLDQWFAPWLEGVTSGAALRRVDLADALAGMFDWEKRKRLDDLAPTHLPVPSGSRVQLDYASGDRPILAVRIQEVFGLRETPRIGGGRVPVILHLLSPAMRPAQITDDLASFWQETYAHVRKELRGRYPKHSWPEDPLTAPPTRRTKRRQDLR